jgi:hypothetical protein
MSDEKRLDKPENDPPRPERASLEELRDWEQVQVNETDSTQRLKVAGGWLYRTVLAYAVAMVFVPDE